MVKKYKITNTVNEHTSDLCIVSDQVCVNGKPLGMMVKSEPVSELDSGWQFLSGQESEKYVANSHTASIFSVKDMIVFNPELAEYVNDPVGTEIIFELD